MTDKSIKAKYCCHSDMPLKKQTTLQTESTRKERTNADENNQDENIAIQLIDASLSIENIGYSDRTLANRLLKNKSSRNASKTKILKDLNVTIRKGEKVALIGHNGAGKSSFLRLITPDASATISTVALSVSNSTKTSSTSTKSPWFLCHL